jgi:thioredoxin reductase
LPEQLRLEFVRKHLGPAPGWFIRDEVVGKVPFILGVTITEAKVQDGRVCLQLTDRAGKSQTLTADHVIAATGYKTDLRRLDFMHADILAGIRAVDYIPVLSANFESSFPGLYFVGASAANSFGPLMRFAFGARFAADRLAKHFADQGLAKH